MTAESPTLDSAPEYSRPSPVSMFRAHDDPGTTATLANYVRNGRLNITKLAREHTERALNVLVTIMESAEFDSDRIRAACAILDRGYGKPVASLKIQDENTGPSRVDAFAEMFAAEAQKALASVHSAPTPPAPGTSEGVIPLSANDPAQEVLAPKSNATIPPSGNPLRTDKDRLAFVTAEPTFRKAVVAGAIAAGIVK